MVTPLGDEAGRTVVATDAAAPLDVEIVPAAALSDATVNPTVAGLASYDHVYNGTTWDRVRGSLGGIVAGVIAVWTGFLQTLMIGRYLLARPVLADGNGTHVQMNQRGDMATQEQYIDDYIDNANDVAHTHPRAIPTSAGAWSATASLAVAYGLTQPPVVKPTGGRVRKISVTNGSATAAIAMLKNQATIAVAGVLTPDERMVVPANSTVTMYFGDAGRYFSAGICLGIGEIPALADYGTLNARAADDCFYTIEWI